MAGFPSKFNPAVVAPSTVAGFRVQLGVAGAATKYGEWETSAGGGLSANVQKVRIGSDVNKMVTLPNVLDSDDITLDRKFVLRAGGVAAGDVWEMQRELLNLVGVGQMVLTMQPMDANGVPTGKALQHTGGRLSKVTPVQTDNEGTGVARIQVTVIGGRWS